MIALAVANTEWDFFSGSGILEVIELTESSLLRPGGSRNGKEKGDEDDDVKDEEEDTTN